MPTPFAMVVLGLMAVLLVAGIVFWARAAVRRRHDLPGGSSHPEAPWSAEQAGRAQRRAGEQSGGYF